MVFCVKNYKYVNFVGFVLHHHYINLHNKITNLDTDLLHIFILRHISINTSYKYHYKAFIREQTDSHLVNS